MNRPHDDLIAAIGPRVRKSPFFDATIDAGLASVTTYNHMWLPMSYGDPGAEYERLTSGVSMWDVAAQRHIEVAGPDADALVQYLTIVDTSEVKPAFGRYAPMADYDGTLINDPVLLRFDDHSWRFSIADADVRLWIEAVARGGDFDCTITELATATLAVQGPASDEVIIALGCPAARNLADFERRRAEVAGVEVWISRSGWSNQGGYELFLDDPRHAPKLWEAVATAGAPFGIGPGAPNPSERLENVVLSYGTDSGYDATPIELGLSDLIDFEGDGFIGQDALREERRRGSTRRLLGVTFGGESIGTLPNPVGLHLGHRRIGQLRSAAWSPRFSTAPSCNAR
ncbi:MAG: hypothetical protein V9F00_18710 [Nocardioides sp.]|jgi:glycine cleavage system aminomethyltransferase T